MIDTDEVRNEGLRAEARKRGWYKYYSLLRPVSIGTHPIIGMIDFINYNHRTEVNSHMVWAELFYDRELSEKELDDFEMIEG